MLSSVSVTVDMLPSEFVVTDASPESPPESS